MANKTITYLELMKHTKTSDAWVLIDGGVYDVTTYLAEHPGGDDILMYFSGKDASQKFNEQQHTEYAKSIRDQRLVGKIESGKPPKEYVEWTKSFFQKNSIIEWDEVKKHNTEQIYDLTKYADEHPGGKDIIMKVAGKDGTKEFEKANHPQSAIILRDSYQIGKVKPGSKPFEAAEKGGVNKGLVLILGIIIGVVYQYFFAKKE